MSSYPPAANPHGCGNLFVINRAVVSMMLVSRSGYRPTRMRRAAQVQCMNESSQSDMLASPVKQDMRAGWFIRAYCKSHFGHQVTNIVVHRLWKADNEQLFV